MGPFLRILPIRKPFEEKTETDFNHSIIRSPLPVRAAGSLQGLIDYPILRVIIFSALYVPFDQWATLATGLADLEKGNGTTLVQLLGPPPPTPSPCDPPVFESNTIEIQTAIICNDGDVVPSSLEHAEQHFQESLKVSGWGSLLAAVRIKCRSYHGKYELPASAHWKHRWYNPATPLAKSVDYNNTSNDAHKVSKAFPGSVVLQKDGAGHGSFAASPSVCTANVIRRYFVNGTLPEPGTVCPIDADPFSG
ncbi:hypothetical protein MPER_07686 [Moniliophthora perniciosa FA553]|nr:hypothetical protein MPER_07686 [Moniliophthora perniciosa FA553]